MKEIKAPYPTKLPESLSGLIERVTFFNEETGFAVLKVKVARERDLVSVVGTLASVSPGEWINAQGSWIQDKQFGSQFKAELLTSTAPTTREGIEKYLGSGMVKGIGPVYAKKLVVKFGEQIFEIIESHSARLEEVDGIGPQRRRKIKEAWAEQKVIRAIMVFLHSNGVGTSRAVRIYKTYGEAAIDRVQQNPYVLARDIPGIGFKTADQIARQVGIPADSLLRAEAGLSYALLEATSEGHSALPLPQLYEQASELLGVAEPVLAQALARATAAGHVVVDHTTGSDLVYLPHLLAAENRIAARIHLLRDGAPTYPAIDLTRAIAWYEARTGKLLAPSQRAALEQVLTRRAVIITGGPGVGKTTLIDAVLRILRAKKVRCVLCAPTGRAAKRLAEATKLEARTIHRLLESQAERGRFGRDEQNPLECDLLVVDECSMVDLALFHHLLRALPLTASLILVGDADQLPSVGPGSVLHDLIDSAVLPVLRLTEIFRQAASSDIITTAHRINQGMIPEAPERRVESDFYFIDRQDPAQVLSTLVEVVKTRLPAKFGFDPTRDVQLLCPMHRGSLGIRELNLRFQEELNPARLDEPVVEKFGWQFRIRDKVIQTENNYDKDVFNGDIGQIAAIDAEERQVTIRFDDRSVIYEFGELDEIALAYAITIHKSQGSEFPAVVIPLAMQHYMLLQRNLIYTGITRGRKLVVLVGQRQALVTAVRNNKTQKRCGGLLVRLRRRVEPFLEEPT